MSYDFVSEFRAFLYAFGLKMPVHSVVSMRKLLKRLGKRLQETDIRVDTDKLMQISHEVQAGSIRKS